MSGHGHQKSGRKLPSSSSTTARPESRDSGKQRGVRSAKKEKVKEEVTETKQDDKAEVTSQSEQENRGETPAAEGTEAGEMERGEEVDGQSRDGLDDREGSGYEADQETQSRDAELNYDTASQLEYPAPEEIAPEDFDTKSFVSCMSQLSEKIHSDNVRKMDDDFEEQELTDMVHSVTTAMNNYKNYTMHSQKQLEKLRDEIKDAKERMLRKVQARSYDARPGERVPVDERQLEAKVQNLNKELAKAAEELARAQQISAETEAAAVQSAALAEQAAEEAEEIQKEFEARKAEEAETRRREEKKKREEEQRKEAEVRRMEEEKKREEARRAKLRKEEVERPEWEDWPIFSYYITKGEFDNGVACLARGDPYNFKENMLTVSKVDQEAFTLVYEENEELVSNIIRIESQQDQLPKPVQILIPHCMSRASAMSREPVIKAETKDGWKALRTREIHLEDHRDLKLVQAELSDGNVNLAVVTRFKKDFLLFGKKGGRAVSAVDSRVSFTAARNTFEGKEHFVLQMQPVDSATVHEAKKKPEVAELLTTSSIYTLEWSSPSFGAAITINLPVPPNPVKAKKAAAARAAKEAKMKNQKQAAQAQEEEAPKPKKKQERKKTVAQVLADGEEETKVKPTKWYMGQYGVTEDDENDDLHFLTIDPKGKWQVVDNIHVSAIRLDVVEFQLDQPINKFMVIRTKTNCTVKTVVKIAEILSSMLSERIVNFIVKQKASHPREIIACVAPPSRLDRVLEKLHEDGYTGDGPEESMDIVVSEGQQLGISFRANITATEDCLPADMVFNSQLDNFTTFEVTEVDKFLQKNYDVYRGYIQLVKKVAVACVPPPRKKSTSVKPPDASVADGKEEEEEQEEEVHQTTYESTTLYEHLIGIPKDPEDIAPQPIHTAPVIIRNRDDPITPEVLETIAGQLGDEWHRLATYLNIKKARVQAILRNCHVNNKGETEAKYHMLLTWLKRVPKGVNKVVTLCEALSQADREDLAIEVEEIDSEFHSQRKGIS